MKNESEMTVVEKDELNHKRETARHNYFISAKDYYGVPDHIAESLAQYIVYRKPVGGFLEEVIKDSLSGAFSQADDFNRHRLFCIVKFIYNKAPGACWGSEQKFRDHMDGKHEYPWDRLLPSND